MTEDKVCFVQFMHPGAEHEPPDDGKMGWNSGDHARKFLVANGLATSRRGAQADELVFWGEWEPQSRVVEAYDPTVLDGPRWLHEPTWSPLEPPRWSQNTDPFVFGDRFHYTGCQQHKRNRRGAKQPTQLRRLARGSVILFGSCRRDRFMLDTVFVVDRYVDHRRKDRATALAGKISATYEAVTIDPWYRGNDPDDVSYRLYFGATVDAPIEGMFSYVPCLPRADAPSGFARPSRPARDGGAR
jgi:hypothetical protein